MDMPKMLKVVQIRQIRLLYSLLHMNSNCCTRSKSFYKCKMSAEYFSLIAKAY